MFPWIIAFAALAGLGVLSPPRLMAEERKSPREAENSSRELEFSQWNDDVQSSGRHVHPLAKLPPLAGGSLHVPIPDCSLLRVELFQDDVIRPLFRGTNRGRSPPVA